MIKLFISGFQVITIDAEALPDDGENAKHQNTHEEKKKRPSVIST